MKKLLICLFLGIIPILAAEIPQSSGDTIILTTSIVKKLASCEKRPPDAQLALKSAVAYSLYKYHEIQDSKALNDWMEKQQENLKNEKEKQVEGIKLFLTFLKTHESYFQNSASFESLAAKGFKASALISVQLAKKEKEAFGSCLQSYKKTLKKVQAQKCKDKECIKRKISCTNELAKKLAKSSSFDSRDMDKAKQKKSHDEFMKSKSCTGEFSQIAKNHIPKCSAFSKLRISNILQCSDESLTVQFFNRLIELFPAAYASTTSIFNDPDFKSFTDELSQNPQLGELLTTSAKRGLTFFSLGNTMEEAEKSSLNQEKSTQNEIEKLSSINTQWNQKDSTVNSQKEQSALIDGHPNSQDNRSFNSTHQSPCSGSDNHSLCSSTSKAQSVRGVTTIEFKAFESSLDQVNKELQGLNDYSNLSNKKKEDSLQKAGILMGKLEKKVSVEKDFSVSNTIAKIKELLNTPKPKKLVASLGKSRFGLKSSLNKPSKKTSNLNQEKTNSKEYKEMTWSRGDYSVRGGDYEYDQVNEEEEEYEYEEQKIAQKKIKRKTLFHGEELTSGLNQTQVQSFTEKEEDYSQKKQINDNNNLNIFKIITNRYFESAKTYYPNFKDF